MPDVAVVTGAGSGLGAVIAEQLAGRGLSIVVNVRSDVAGAEEVAGRIRASGGTAVVIGADVTSETEVAAMFGRVRALGPLRVLVNNASLRRLQPVEQITVEDFAQVLDVTLVGAFTCVRHALPLLGEHGRIINILGSNALAGDARRVHVSAAKHGLLGLTLALGEALRPRGITVNAVSPAIDVTDPVDLLECQQRVGQTVALLTAADAVHVTGTIVGVDCGQPSGP